MQPAEAVAIGITFTWLGMVLAISFLETPLKFQAPGVTLQIGLGIGRLVFRALNFVEMVAAMALLVTVLVGDESVAAALAAYLVVVVFLAQVIVVRPLLTRRSDRVLAGEEDAPRSHGHLWYVGLEVAKVVGLAVTGTLLLSGGVS